MFTAPAQTIGGGGIVDITMRDAHVIFAGLIGDRVESADVVAGAADSSSSRAHRRLAGAAVAAAALARRA